MKSGEMFWRVGALSAGVLLVAWLFPQVVQAILIIAAGAFSSVFIAHLSKLFRRFVGGSYRLSFAIVVVGSVLLVSLVGIYLGNRIASQTERLISAVEQASNTIQADLESQQWWRQLRSYSQRSSPNYAISQAIATARSVMVTGAWAASGALIVVVLGLYFAFEPERYQRGMLRLFSPSRRARVSEVLDKAGNGLWRWVLGRMVGMLVIGVASWIGLWIAGVPMAMSLGVLAGLLNFVPNIGPLVAAVPAVLLAMQQGTDVAVGVLIYYCALQFVESYLLTPLIDKHQVSLPPGLTLSAQLLLGTIAGFLGLFLATPLTLVAVIVLNEYLNARPEE